MSVGLLKILMKEKDDEQNYVCQNCRGILYPLEGSVEHIFVCESCGKSYDYETICDTNNSKKQIPIYALFNEQFMKKYTNFESFDDFIKECPISFDEFSDTFDESIPLKYPKKWNKYVHEHEKAIELHLHV
jgi:hypothetical protein